ncbi:MAG: uracil phosphoribosyltransferase [Mongoliibacter sp.]|uniref:uracil phosphoribosyltransferase n=1 Tax=Mongoliibacter sp. TaxID=2022438 RepID=UPI0012F098A6|nr:uracil phosphoribosyltransferase [Mongoliibacter sp.]TVP49869.1 MAG: uracil phosphoribosyltransferase [Mongoliibacter sp.]
MFVLSDHDNIVLQYLTELRDIEIQKDRSRFRNNLERIGTILAYELSKDLSYQSIGIQTPIEKTTGKILQEQPLLICVMRAAMPFFQGFLNVFDRADCGFVGAYRKEAGKNISIDFLYQATPDLTDREVILIDPMLATGKSIISTVENLLKIGKPKMLHVVGAIAAPEGIDHISKNLGLDHKFWIGAIDRALNEKSYIVPGLGDAGDLAFGPKL